MKKILLVDDEVISILTLSRYLRDNGYEVDTAGNGRDALRLGESSPPDVLLSDWKLQDEIDGLELVRRLTPINPKMKSIIISGLSAEDVPEGEVNDLIFRFLCKPCSISTVLETVHDALKSTSEENPRA